MPLISCPHCGVETTDRQPRCYYCKGDLSVAPAPKAPALKPLAAAKDSVSSPVVPNSKVSFWSKIKEVHRTTIENVAIQTLRQNYVALVNLGLSLPAERSAEATTKLVALANEMRPHFSNLSEEGVLQVAKRVAKDARSDQHLNRSSAIAKGLLAVWIECHARNHPLAELIKTDLDNLINANSTREDQVKNIDFSAAMTIAQQQIFNAYGVSAPSDAQRFRNYVALCIAGIAILNWAEGQDNEGAVKELLADTYALVKSLQFQAREITLDEIDFLVVLTDFPPTLRIGMGTAINGTGGLDAILNTIGRTHVRTILENNRGDFGMPGSTAAYVGDFTFGEETSGAHFVDRIAAMSQFVQALVNR